MRKFLMGAATMLAAASWCTAVLAAPVVTGPMTLPTPHGPITAPNPNSITVAKPDLVITKLTLIPQPNTPGPALIGKIAFDIADNCHRGIPYKMFVKAQIFTAKGGKGLAEWGNTGGIGPNGTGHLELDVTNENYPMTYYVYATVDANNQIPEIVETNNYQSLNPNTGPFPQAAGYCNAK